MSDKASQDRASQAGSIERLYERFPLFTTRRLILRAIAPEDADALFALYGDDAVARWLDICTLTKPAEAAEIAAFFAERYANRSGVRWGIALAEAPAHLIGTCGYNGFDREHQRSEIGYDLAPAFWRRGIMAEALTAILDYGFGMLQLNRVEAITLPDNAASQALLQKLGFQREGTLRQRSYYRGQYQDDVHFGLLRADWEAQRRSAGRNAPGREQPANS